MVEVATVGDLAAMAGVCREGSVLWLTRGWEAGPGRGSPGLNRLAVPVGYRAVLVHGRAGRAFVGEKEISVETLADFLGRYLSGLGLPHLPLFLVMCEGADFGRRLAPVYGQVVRAANATMWVNTLTGTSMAAGADVVDGTLAPAMDRLWPVADYTPDGRRLAAHAVYPATAVPHSESPAWTAFGTTGGSGDAQPYTDDPPDPGELRELARRLDAMANHLLNVGGLNKGLPTTYLPWPPIEALSWKGKAFDETYRASEMVRTNLGTTAQALFDFATSARQMADEAQAAIDAKKRDWIISVVTWVLGALTLGFPFGWLAGKLAEAIAYLATKLANVIAGIGVVIPASATWVRFLAGQIEMGLISGVLWGLPEGIATAATGTFSFDPLSFGLTFGLGALFGVPFDWRPNVKPGVSADPVAIDGAGFKGQPDPAPGSRGAPGTIPGETGSVSTGVTSVTLDGPTLGSRPSTPGLDGQVDPFRPPPVGVFAEKPLAGESATTLDTRPNSESASVGNRPVSGIGGPKGAEIPPDQALVVAPTGALPRGEGTLQPDVLPTLPGRPGATPGEVVGPDRVPPGSERALSGGGGSDEGLAGSVLRPPPPLVKPEVGPSQGGLRVAPEGPGSSGPHAMPRLPGSVVPRPVGGVEGSVPPRTLPVGRTPVEGPLVEPPLGESHVVHGGLPGGAGGVLRPGEVVPPGGVVRPVGVGGGRGPLPRTVGPLDELPVERPLVESPPGGGHVVHGGLPGGAGGVLRPGEVVPPGGVVRPVGVGGGRGPLPRTVGPLDELPVERPLVESPPGGGHVVHEGVPGGAGGVLRPGEVVPPGGVVRPVGVGGGRGPLPRTVGPLDELPVERPLVESPPGGGHVVHEGVPGGAGGVLRPGGLVRPSGGLAGDRGPLPGSGRPLDELPVERPLVERPLVEPPPGGGHVVHEGVPGGSGGVLRPGGLVRPSGGLAGDRGPLPGSGRPLDELPVERPLVERPLVEPPPGGGHVVHEGVPGGSGVLRPGGLVRPSGGLAGDRGPLPGSGRPLDELPVERPLVERPLVEPPPPGGGHVVHEGVPGGSGGALRPGSVVRPGGLDGDRGPVPRTALERLWEERVAGDEHESLLGGGPGTGGRPVEVSLSAAGGWDEAALRLWGKVPPNGSVVVRDGVGKFPAGGLSSLWEKVLGAVAPRGRLTVPAERVEGLPREGSVVATRFGRPALAAEADEFHVYASAADAQLARSRWSATEQIDSASALHGGRDERFGASAQPHSPGHPGRSSEPERVPATKPLSQAGADSRNDALPPERSSVGQNPGGAAPPGERVGELADAHPLPAVGTQWIRNVKGWHDALGDGAFERFDDDGQLVLVDVPKGSRGIFDGSGELRMVELPNKLTYDRGPDLQWSSVRVTRGELIVNKVKASVPLRIVDGKTTVVVRSGQEVRDVVTDKANVYFAVEKFDGPEWAQGRAFVRVADDLWDVVDVEPAEIEASLAAGNKAFDTALSMYDIAARYRPTVPGVKGLRDLTVADLGKLMLKGGLNDAAAAFYEMLRRFDGKLMRWTQMEAVRGLMRGEVVNMGAGEGKSLAYLAYAARTAVLKHVDWVMVITTRDNLAAREFEEYNKFLTSYGFDIVRMNPEGKVPRPVPDRPTIYIGTHEDNAFSMLRGQKLPGRGFAVVDEFDEFGVYANTFFMISDGDGALASRSLVKQLVWARDFIADNLADGSLTLADFGRVTGRLGGEAALTRAGKLKIEQQLLGRKLTPLEHHRLNNEALARWTYVKKTHYTTKNGELYLIDQVTHKVMADLNVWTGRVAMKTRLTNGLSQALELKEDLPILADPKTSKSLTLEQIYAKENFASVVGSSGTALDKEAAYAKKGLPNKIVDILPYFKLRLRVAVDKMFATSEEKFAAVVSDTAAAQKLGRPQVVLVHDNARVADVSDMLHDMRVEHTAIDADWFLDQGPNAEAEFQRVVDEAVKQGKVTVGNMQLARGVDFKGSGLQVRITARSAISHDIDIQAQRRVGRSGEDGDAQFYTSLDDDLYRLSYNPNVQLAVIRFSHAIEADRAISSVQTGATVAQAAAALTSLVPKLQSDAASHLGIRGPPTPEPDASLFKTQPGAGSLAEEIPSGLFLHGAALTSTGLAAAKDLPQWTLGTRLVPDASLVANMHVLASLVATLPDAERPYFLDLQNLPGADFELTPVRATLIANTVGIDVVIAAGSSPPTNSFAIGEDGNVLEGSGVVHGYLVSPHADAPPYAEKVDPSTATPPHDAASALAAGATIKGALDGSAAGGLPGSAAQADQIFARISTLPVDHQVAVASAVDYLTHNGRTELAGSYLTEPDPYERRAILRSAVVEAGPDLLHALVQLSQSQLWRGSGFLNSERAEVNVIGAFANALGGDIDLSQIHGATDIETNRMRAAALGISRNLVPNYLTDSDRVEWVSLSDNLIELNPGRALGLDVVGIAALDC